MKRRPTDTPQAAYVAPISALFVACALDLAVFYHGPQIPLLAGAQFLLIAWLALSLACSYESGVRLLLTPMSITLTLFRMWLGISLLWSTVLVTNAINFLVGRKPGARSLGARAVTATLTRVVFCVALRADWNARALRVRLDSAFLWGEPPRATFINIQSFTALMILIALSLGGYFLKLGESERAKDIEQKLIAMREAIAKTVPVRSVVPDQTLPISASSR